jgi:chromosome segregation ATPase
LKGLKDERKRLEEECDGLGALLDANVQKLKNLERMVRNSESVNARLDKTLHQAENDHQKLIAEVKIRNEDAKRAENKLRGISTQINEAKITYNNVLNQSEKNKAEAGANAANLNNEVAKGKELAAKIAGVESSIRGEENHLDLIIAEEEKLRKQHFLGLDDNKLLNSELDKLLSMINEYELINKELIDEIEIYADQDQQAISILNRRQQMKDLIAGTLRKLQVTEETIKHIKY